MGKEAGHGLAHGMIGVEDLGQEGGHGNEGREDAVAELHLAVVQDALESGRGQDLGEGQARGLGEAAAGD